MADLDDVVETLAVAFGQDPVMRWAFADEVRPARLRALWSFMAARAYLPAGASTVVPGDAAALWLPLPGRLDPGFYEANGADLVAALEGDLDRLGTFSAMVSEHHPHEPHRYLLAIGVRPDRQGAGFGSLLLQHTTASADDAGEDCYLEATSESSRRLYERHDFEVTAAVQLPDGPMIWAMTRTPRPPR